MTEAEARDLLGLQGPLDLDKVRKAWRQRAASLHPDRFPESERAAKGAELADVNAAWSLLQRLLHHQDSETTRGDLARQIGVFYRARDGHVRDALEEAAEEDAEALASSFWKGLLRARLPQRPRPLTVVLCGAVEITPTSAIYLFEAPLPEGRAAIMVPRLRRSAQGVQVQIERPMVLPVQRRGQQWIPPFGPKDAADLGLERLEAVFPSTTLDITKTVRLDPPTGWQRLLYTL